MRSSDGSSDVCSSDLGWLYKLAVSPARRHQGLGRRLVAHAEAWLAGQGMPKINLMIRDTNAAVRDFYVRLGYAVAPRIVMQKGLDAAHAKPAARSLDIIVTHLERSAEHTSELQSQMRHLYGVFCFKKKTPTF